MKRFANVTALLAAMVMALALAGCGNLFGIGKGNGKGGKAALATEWEATQTRKKGTMWPYSTEDTDIVGGPITLAFYDDGTYVWSGPSEVTYEGDYKGTYTGDTALPGDWIKLTGDIFAAGNMVLGTVSDDGNSLNLNYDLGHSGDFSFKYYYLFKKSE